MERAGSRTGRIERQTLVFAGVIAAAGLIAWAVFFGLRARDEPQRCPEGLVARGPRCCAPGQHERASHCTGFPTSCPRGFELHEKRAGCVFVPSRVAIPAGELTVGPSDWDAEVERRTIRVDRFLIDRTEVTRAAYQTCVEAGICSRSNAIDSGEPGLPVTGVTAEDAAAFCRYHGGRLPTVDEWIFAGAGAEGRRFPWGAHGLVCRRASYGLAEGPCAEGSTSPELAGARPEGATPAGVLDLVGNVAEWVRDKKGGVRVVGGSFRSKRAGELKTWMVEPPHRGDDVGFRCVYGKPQDLIPTTTP